MKTMISGLALAMALGGFASLAAAQPSGGPDAKGNAPLKAPHTVNDGVAKPGANSFTQGQAQKHIEASGFANVTGLTKGADGVWRGQAMKDGQPMGVAMDFKGNVTTSEAGGADQAGSVDQVGGETAGVGSSAARGASSAGQPSVSHHHRRRHHRRHLRSDRCTAAEHAGAACSGVSTRQNGVSDKEAGAVH